jgi:hypothetical protein
MADLHSYLTQTAQRQDVVTPPFDMLVHRGRRRRAAFAAAAVVIAAGAIGGLTRVGVFTTHHASQTSATAAAQPSASPTPGSAVVTALGQAAAATGSGTQTIGLTASPHGATRLDAVLTCLTAGTFTTDGGVLTCTPADLGTITGAMSWSVSLTTSPLALTITAAAGLRWDLHATYVSATTTPWGINTRGQTYGVANASGTPDLVSAIATNGRSGYVEANQLSAATHAFTRTSPADAATASPQQASIPVYEADGTTVIGRFSVGTGETGGADGLSH